MKQSLEYVFDQLETGVQIINENMQYIFLNKSLLRQLGKTLEDHVGKRMEDVYPGIEKTDVYESIKNCLKTGNSYRVTNEFFFEDGRTTYWDLELAKVSDKVVILSRDISSTKEGERLLLESNLRLEAEIKKRTKDLEKSNKRIREILGHVSHDLRNTLGIVLSLADYMETKGKMSTSKISTIRKMSEKSLEIVYSILEGAALGTGKITLNKAKTNIANIINSRIKILIESSSLIESRFKLLLDNSLEAEVDPLRIEQVLDNLISNALKYSPDDSVILITLTKDGNFSIKNRIDTHKVEKLKPTNLKESAGFGLEIINSILELHSLKLTITKENNEYLASFNLKEELI
ncbi:PAS domain-containing protein [Halobacteriovorax sp. GFR7]|uniref:PAS domain-containing sensor histidine kinase n=1 Tax=unclassified Halobacteriovorax TaxID=2639665 RepID=UPI003D955E24